MTEARFVPLTTYRRYPEHDMAQRANEFYADISRRRTAREFSERNVPRTIIEDCLRAAGTAPSGANMQPWHFVVVEDPAIKKLIRAAAEKEEHEFYTHVPRPRGWKR